MAERRRHDLALAPSALYRAKALLTHARSLAWRAGGARAGGDGLRILFYHRISDDHDELAVSPRRFRAQMELLAAEGCEVVDVMTVAERLAAGHAHAGVVGLCFDDGYRDIVDEALPVLERLGFRATVFVATGVVDGTATFGWYSRQPPVMSWPTIHALSRGSPFGFGAHTVTHPDLRTLSEPDARAEIAGSKAALEARLEQPVEAFCYPAGLYGERERRLAGAAGFRVATSCEPGANGPDADLLALRRIQVDRRDRLLDVRAKVAGGHDAPSRVRAAYRRRRHDVRARGA
jgi:peptidoglycan/xylan/chitin deacetylase (PgdA/CDA1 family)